MKGLGLAAGLLVPALALAQGPWTVTVAPTMDPLPAGFCAAVHLTVYDPVARDVPRNPLGYRVAMADFDIAVTTPNGTAAVARQIDASHWTACACQGASPGTVATVTATYPAQALAAPSRVPGVALQRTATFTVAPPKGTVNPPGCLAPGSPPVAAASPGPPPAGPASPGAPSSGAPALGTPSPAPSPVVALQPEPPPVAVAPAPIPAPPAPVPATPAPTPATTPTPAAAPALSGRYLVTVTGLRAYQASVDDILSRDGRGDEVYAAAYVRRYDRRTGQLAEFANRKAMPYGDVTNFGVQRVQAGSRSGTGGIQDGDPIPAGPLVAMRNAPAQDATFPWRLWEGVLTDDADALVITPSLWEQDGSNALYTLWTQEQQTLSLSLFSRQSVQDQIAQKTFGALVSGGSGIGGGGGLGGQLRLAGDFAMVNLAMPLVSLLSSSNDRPIGLLANGFDQAVLPTHAVVLTREIIEAALARPALGAVPSPVLASPAAMARIGVLAPKPGVVVIQFEDRNMPGPLGIPERPAIYQMFVQVERVP